MLRLWQRVVIAVVVACVLMQGVECKAAAAETRPRLLVVSNVINGQPPADAAYTNMLARNGFDVAVVTHEALLDKEYLRQFAVVVLSALPYAGEQFSVAGYKLRHVQANLALLRDYVADGGGLILMPAMVEFGEAYGETYNDFLKPFGARYLVQQLRDEESAGVTPYATGMILKNNPITGGLAADRVLYPIPVMRWDNAYSTTPVITDDKAWAVLAQGGAASGTATALNNKDVGTRQTQNRNLFVARQYGKGMIAVSAICSYYTLNSVSSTKENIGENVTGVIDFTVISGEKEGRPSGFGALLESAMRVFADNSLRHGLGNDEGKELPPQPPYPESAAEIDWETQESPPTWAHRVIPSGRWPNIMYDELPDPLVQGEMRYWKALLGPRTRYSSGSGSVREYREAAIKAGYNAIVFAETFADLDAKTWACLVQDCIDNSDDAFVCLPGMEIEGVNGGRYLVLCSERYPDPAWLSSDGKKLQAVRMLSLGWHRHIAVMHRPNSQQLSPPIFKQYQGITVATYNSAGHLVDDGLFAYQWAVANDCNPIPIVIHEVTSPADVAKAANAGYQQILPAPTLGQAIDYFRYAMPHVFDSPPRYFLSEGPILKGWSIYNKDGGKAEWNRDRYRMAIGVESGQPVVEATLFDGFQAVRRWLPQTNDFTTMVDGRHDMQHLYMLLARDARGRRVLSPGLRTVTRNWRLRCGDRQNWLGHFWIYTGWSLNSMPGFALRLTGTGEGTTAWNFGSIGGNPAPVFDYRFFSDHVQMADANYDAKYIDATHADIAGDGANGAPLRPTDVVNGRIRATHFTTLKRNDFAVLEYQVDMSLKQDAVLDVSSPINPVMGSVFKGKNNNLLILPGKQPEPLFPVDDKGRKDMRAVRTIDLPIGSYVAGVIPLTEGLTLHGDKFGYRVAQNDLANVTEGTKWQARYLILDAAAFRWRHSRDWFDTAVDDKAEQALEEMGFRGKLPYRLDLKQGKCASIAYYAHLEAKDGGVSGRCVNNSGRAMLFNVPLLIRGLSQRVPCVLWRADTDALESFAACQGVGYVPFNADATVDFYAGNVAQCDPRLVVEMIAWTAAEARFRVHNPTTEEISTTFATPAAIRTLKAVNQKMTVPAGSSVILGNR